MRRWKFPPTAVIASVIFLLGLTIFLYPYAASWFSQANQSQIIKETLVTDQGKSTDAKQTALQQAREYNEHLSGGTLVEVTGHKPQTIAHTLSPAHPGVLDYDQLLNANDQGVMGRLRIPDIDVDLPIYHGTNDHTLTKGVGHLRGTSLPVGGIPSRAVLTAHRGLPEATLFNDLDKLAVGNKVTLEIFGEVLTYVVTESRVIEPEESDTIRIEEGKDLVTLVTCTPLGVNTHRIIVTAERVLPTPLNDIENAGQPSQLPHFPWWLVVMVGGTLLCGVYVIHSGRKLAVATTNSQDDN